MDASQVSWESPGHGSEQAVTEVMAVLVAQGSSEGDPSHQAHAGRRCCRLGLRANADAHRMLLSPGAR